MNARKNAGIIALVVSVLTLAGIFVYREWGPGGGYGYGYGGHMMYGMGAWGMGGLMLVFWGLILFGLVLMISRLLAGDRSGKTAGEFSCDAREILKSRYARGEIDLAQLKQMQEDLSR